MALTVRLKDTPAISGVEVSSDKETLNLGKTSAKGAMLLFVTVGVAIAVTAHKAVKSIIVRLMDFMRKALKLKLSLFIFEALSF